jgi:hypothetical protein
MTSRFTLFLTEGMIKLPATTLEAINEFFLLNVLAVLKGKSAQEEDEADVEFSASTIKRLAAKIGSVVPSEADIKRVMTKRMISKSFPLDIPQEYVDRVLKMRGEEGVTSLRGEKIKVILSLDGKHPLLKGSDSSGIFSDDPLTMVINFPSLQVMSDKVVNVLLGSRLSTLEAMIEHGLGTVEHELTHGIQAHVLKKLHSQQFDQHGARSAKGDADGEYFTSQVEFDPQIKSAVKQLKVITTKAGVKPGSPEERQLISRFTSEDLSIKDLTSSPDRSVFFSKLKRYDYKQWKKAVKLLMGLLKRS